MFKKPALNVNKPTSNLPRTYLVSVDFVGVYFNIVVPVNTTNLIGVAFPVHMLKDVMLSLKKIIALHGVVFCEGSCRKLMWSSTWKMDIFTVVAVQKIFFL